MNDLTEKEALYILRHRKEYNDNKIDRAINKIKRINSHRAEYIKRHKKRLKDSISKKKVEDEIEELKNMNVGGEVFTTAVNFAIKSLQELLDK